MTRRTVGRMHLMLAIIAAGVLGLVASSAAAVAMPPTIGIIDEGHGTAVTAESIAPPDVSISACRSDDCILPVRQLTDERLRRLHLVAAGPNQIGFVAFIDGQTVVADGVSIPRATVAQWLGGHGRIGFIEN